MMALLMVMTVTAKALSYETARSEALFLSDKMAYELNLSPSQYEAIYEINLDYFMCVGSALDLYSDLWKQRNFEIQRVLTPYQYEEFLRIKYFYRPLGWRDGRWEFRIYRVYPNRGHFMMNRPRAYGSYRGGRHFRGGPGPRGGARPGGPRPGVRPGGPAPRGGARPGGSGPRPNQMRGGNGGPRPDQMRGGNGGPRPNQMRGGNPGPRPNQMRGNGQAPRPNQFRGGNGGNRQGGPNGTTRRTETRRMGPQSYATPQGIYQRSGTTTRTTVTTTRQFQNQRPQQAQRQQVQRQQVQRQQQSRPQAQRPQGQRSQQFQRQPQGQRPQGQRPQQGQRPRR